MRGAILMAVMLSSLAATVAFAANERQVTAAASQRLGLPAGSIFLFR